MLETRIALAISAFSQANFTSTSTSTSAPGGTVTATTTTPGWVTIVSDNHDDIYLQQVATAPESLLYADNSSFVNAGAIADIDSFYKTLYVTNGQARGDVGIQPNNSPMYSPLTTRFRLNDGYLSGYTDDPRGEIFGSISCVQADRRTTTWTFTDWTNTAYRLFDSDFFRITSGPGYGDQRTSFAGSYEQFQSLPAGYVYPEEVRLRNNNDSGGRASIEVVWSDTLAPSAMPTLTARYYVVSAGEIRDSSGVQPSAPVKSTFTLPNATGDGSLGIVPGTFSGSVGLGGAAQGFQLAALGGTALRFPANSSLAGSYSPDGTVTIQYLGYRKVSTATIGGGLGGGLFGGQTVTTFIPEDPGPLDLTASYAVYLQDQKPNTVTFFAGHDITREVSVELLTPGSSINVDSPIKVGSLLVGSAGNQTDLLAGGDVELRASNVYLNATVKSNDRLIIGNPLDGIPNTGIVAPAPHAPPVRSVGSLIANIAGGKVLSIEIPPGFNGAGYDYDNPPQVDIAPPSTVGATARATGINGKVYLIQVTNGGAGYATAPIVEFSDPDLPNGVKPTATADVLNGVVQRIVVTTPGIGYSRPPTVTIRANAGVGGAAVGQGATAVARIRGAITSISVVEQGIGYTSAPVVTIGGGNGQATATATVTEGQITGITVTNGGDDYTLDGSTTVTIAAPPENSSPDPARAEVDFDTSRTRIIGIKVTYPGSGYGTRPTVTVGAPTPVSSASIAGSIADGSVSQISVKSSGYGYQSEPLVWISPPPREVGGEQATATATIDKEGRVTKITVTNPGSGYDPENVPVFYIAPPHPIAETETVRFDAAVAAAIYDVRVANDLDTPNVERGSFVVSQSGSLSRDIYGGTQADSIFVQAQQSDIYVEGAVFGKNQSYLMQSLSDASDLSPYVFATRSAATGADTGVIKGGTVGVTLGNDAPTPQNGSVIFNDVSLSTAIDSFRIRAATRVGTDRPEPFPYRLTLTESNDIAIDAVAASSFPISLNADGNIAFTAALATASDLLIQALDNLTVTAPVSTTVGKLDLRGRNLSIGSSLKVLNPVSDELNDDITLTASNGDVGIQGLISAPNTVRINQKNRVNPSSFQAGNRTPLPIPDVSTVTQSITIADNFTFDDVNVQLDITHTYDSDLSAVLIAPDGTRIRLFTGVGGSGDNFTGTIFDSEATTPIAAGSAPFTGSFKPQESLAALYGRSVQGTWRLQVTDNAGGDVGILNNFTLLFQNTLPQVGRIYGNALIRADRLAIDAEGSVGIPSLYPTDKGFYLRTNVNHLDATVRDNVAIDEASALSIDNLRAGGLVSLRVKGVDVQETPAVTGEITDLSGLDVSAPNGSISLTLNSPKSIVLGNASALRLGKSFSMVAGGSVSIRSLGGATRGDITALDAPLAGTGARVVRAIWVPTTEDASTYSYNPGRPGTIAGSIRSIGNNSIQDRISSVTDLRVGDRVLVALAVPSKENGVYVITSLGSTSTPWTMVRASDSDTGAELPSYSYVRVTGGSSTEVGVHQITYDATARMFGRKDVTVSAVLPLTTDIGSDDSNDTTTFVVSTTGSSTSAAGSLGKMIRLRQEQKSAEQPMDFRFSSAITGPIQLTEELPNITQSFTIDGNRRYTPAGSPPATISRFVVDGSRITTTNTGAAFTSKTELNGFTFTNNSDGATLANITVSGFRNGSAVLVKDANAILLHSLTLGLGVNGDRLSNKYGVTIAGSSNGVTLSNSTIASSSQAGVQVRDTATNFAMVATTVGVLGRENQVGFLATSTGTANRIGVDLVQPSVPIPPALATKASSSSFSLSATYASISNQLFPGLQVRGDGIVPANNELAATIESVSKNPVDGSITVAIRNGTVAGNGSVAFGQFARTLLGEDTLTLPKSVPTNRLFLGQSITGNGIAPGTTIKGISLSNGTLKLSAKMTADGTAAISFGAAGQNMFQYNYTGLRLESGEVSLTNTGVMNNVFDGIVITGGSMTIGTSTVRSTRSNIIAGNGRWGIVIEAQGTDFSEATAMANKQTIQGNFIGTNSKSSTTTNLLNKRGNIGIRIKDTARDTVFAGLNDRYTASAASLFVDKQGNRYGLLTGPQTGGSGTGGIR